jgi:hypothetical protein
VAPTLDEIEQQVNGKGDRSDKTRYRRHETPPGQHLLIVPRRFIKNPVTIAFLPSSLAFPAVLFSLHFLAEDT